MTAPCASQNSKGESATEPDARIALSRREVLAIAVLPAVLPMPVRSAAHARESIPELVVSDGWLLRVSDFDRLQLA
jgi:hypothetical protein